MEEIKKILADEMKMIDAIFINIGKYPEMFQPNAEIFWKGRKIQLEELQRHIAKVFSSNAVLAECLPTEQYPDNEADGIVFCGKCGAKK